MVANRTKDLVITEGGETYSFPILEENGARKVLFKTEPWQTGVDPEFAFRKSIFPLYSGVGRDRVNSDSHYAKCNGDASYPNIWIHPPALTTVTLTNGNSPFKFKAFNSLIFVLGGRYMYYIDPTTNAATEDKDFGVGKAAVDMEVFNNELVVAMGESEKIYTRNTAGTWTQATDNTFAIALGLVDSKLWRGEEINQLSNAITAPLTLTSWVPSDGNEYTAGDTTWSINTIIDFQGAVWVGKGDGMYASDPTFVFHNQTPQIARNPHTDSCKGAFVAHTSLWIPYSGGLLRIRLGSSLPYGPEITWRHDYRFWIRGGVEHNSNIYLIVTDQASVGETTIYKMIPLDEKRTIYAYHEWVRLGSATKGYAIIATSIATNPKIMVTHGNDAKVIVMGRGGGADIDDSNYVYGTSAELESGKFLCGPDLSIVTHLVGVEVVCDYSAANESLTVSYQFDSTGSYTNFLTEAAGSAPITLTTNFESVKRYTPTVDVHGQFLEIKLSSTLVTTSSSPVVRDVIVFGYMHPMRTDKVTISIDASQTWTALGIAQPRGAYEAYRLFREWADDHVMLLVELYEYDDGKSTYFQVGEVVFGESVNEMGESITPDIEGNLVVTLIRVPFGVGEYAA